MSLSSQIKVPAQVKGAVGGGSGGTPQNIDTAASPQFAGINLGHASDTTLGRTSAGLANVEGVDLVTISATQTLTNKTLGAATITGAQSWTNGGHTVTITQSSGDLYFDLGTAAKSYIFRGSGPSRLLDIGSTGLVFASAHTALSGSAIGVCRDGSGLLLYSGDTNSRGVLGNSFQGQLSVWGTATTYAGAVHIVGRLVTRANSTAYSVCPVASTEVARILLQDNSGKRAVALVDASGTVTFESGSHADYVASSSPASGEVGCYVTSNVFTIKPGSAGTRKISAICQMGAN